MASTAAGATDAPDRLPPGRDPALGEDDHQRRVAEHPGQPGVVEGDARARARRAPARAPGTAAATAARCGREPDRHDGDEQHGGGDEQRGAELVHGHAAAASLAQPGSRARSGSPVRVPPVPRRRALRLSLVGLGALLVVILVVAFVTTVVVVRRPFPSQDGTITLPGLSAPVTVIRDDRGIPQIYARRPTTCSAPRGTCRRRTGSSRWTSGAT